MTNRKHGRADDTRAKMGIDKTRLPSQLSNTVTLQLAVNPTSEEIGHLVTLFNQCRYAEGKTIALQLTKRYPLNGFGWKVLGAIIKLQGRTEESLGPMQKAATLMPTDAQVHNNLGVTLKDLGRLREAEASYRQALEIKPDYTEAYRNLGVTLKDLGRLKEAEASYRRALEIKPDFAEVHNNLGITLKDLGRLKEAEASYRRALEIKPDFAEVHNNLGNILKDLGRLREAEASYRRALEIKPDFAEVHNNLGNILKDLGRLKEAEASYRRALEIKPDFAEVHNNLGITVSDLGRLREAEASYRRALEIKPDFAEVHNNLGVTLKDLGRLKKAEASCCRAIEIKPDYADAHNNLGNTLSDLGRLQEAEASYRQALAIKPDYADAQSNLLFALINIPDHHPSYYLEEARKYGQMVASRVERCFSGWRCAPHPERLRVGLVSGDLRNHPGGYFLESVLRHLDSSRIELIAYCTSYKADELTKRIRPYFSGWKSLVGLNDEAAASLIHRDGVHVLLDLSGHTAYNRLPVFAWKPAPVQATWLGYLASTGVAEIDYLIGDPHATPPEHDGHLSETVWRMPEVWVCFTPPAYVVEVGPLPALSTGSITFGCFNNLTKMNDAVVTLWSRVLHAVPSSRLFLKTKQLRDPGVCDTVLRRFLDHGITTDRLLLEGSSSRETYLEAYNRVDIALNPFPYGGVTVTCEALWMGVPVMTRKGDRFLSQCGESVDFNTGLSDWIAEDDDDYAVKTVVHAQDLKQLATLREGLRRQVLSSPLCDAPRFARNLEDALWGMWEQTKPPGLL